MRSLQSVFQVFKKVSKQIGAMCLMVLRLQATTETQKLLCCSPTRWLSLHVSMGVV